jgi:putative ABC transport system permease protein
MDWNPKVRAAFASRAVPDDDIVEELAQHAASAFEAARADGCDPAEAARRVQAQLAEWARDERMLARRPRRPPAIEPPAATAPAALAGLGQDLRYTFHMMRRQWAHSAVVALTLALGVGSTTVLFSVADGVLLKPMPWPDADRLVRVYETRQGSARKPVFLTNGTYLAWSDKPATVESVAGWSAHLSTLTGGGQAERVRVVETTANLFAMLGARPARGRLFATVSGGRADTTEVVLSHQLWQRRFGGAADVIGRPLRIDGQPYRVVGVMPPGFGFPDRDVFAYIPFDVPPVGGKNGQGGTMAMFSAIAKLRPGATPAQAAAEATSRGRAVPDPGLVTMAVFGTRGAVQVSAVPLLDSVVGEVRPALLVFLAAVGLLLVVATANVASLQLARATSRRREIAIRSALGAGTARLTRQLLVENVIVGQIGGLAGLGLAAALIRALPALAPADFPRVGDISLDWRVALFSLGVSLVASLVFGLAPVLQARGVDVAGALAEDGLAPVGGHTRSKTARARLLIMTGQIATAAILLVGAALLARSFLALMHADRGYNSANLLTTQVALPEDAFPPQRRAEVLDHLMDRLRAVPGVTAAAYSTRLPLASGGEILAAFPVPARKGSGTVSAHAAIRQVSPGFFAALGLRVREGRGFTDGDSRTSGEVLVVNRSFARQYLDSPAVGTRLPTEKGTREVVGVIDDANYGAATDTVQPEIYTCIHQANSGFGFQVAAVLVRTTGDPGRLTPILGSLVREQGSSIALGPVMTMEDRVLTSLARPRLYAVLLGGFAAFALAVAGVGLFGVLSYTVSLRAREIGVRASLGATPWNIIGLVVRQATFVTAAGLIVGLGAAAALAHLLGSLLYGVAATDPMTFVAVGALLASVAVVACVVPARRAARVDPVRVLR